MLQKKEMKNKPIKNFLIEKTVRLRHIMIISTTVLYSSTVNKNLGDKINAININQ